MDARITIYLFEKKGTVKIKKNKQTKKKNRDESQTKYH